MKDNLRIFASITIFFMICSSIALSQEGPKSIKKYDHVLQISDTPLTKKEWRTLNNPKKHKENEVIVKLVDEKAKLNFLGENGYLVFYYYMEDDKLKSTWVQVPGTGFDQLHYKWEPTFFHYKLENSKTGKKSAMSIL